MLNNKFKSRPIFVIIVPIIILVLVVGYLLVYKNSGNDWKKDSMDVTPSLLDGNFGDISTEQENEIKNLFDGWMKKQKGFTEYKVTSVNRVVRKSDVSGEDIDFFFPIESTEKAYVASVKFSVKAEDQVALGFWIAGNGYTEPNDTLLVLDKVLLLTIDNVNGQYQIINIGTGF